MTIAIEPFLSYWSTHRSASPETITAYRSDLGLFSKFLDEHAVKSIRQVNHLVVNDYIEHMRTVAVGRTGKPGLSEATIARRLAAVSSFFEYSRATSKTKLTNPLEDYSGRRWKRNNKPKPADEVDLEKLFAAITSERDKVLVTLFLASGLRLSEMTQLTRETIKVQKINEVVKGTAREIVLGVGEIVGKGNKVRTFLIDKEALITYLRYAAKREDDIPALFISERKQPMAERSMQERLAYWCKTAGIDHLNIHRLRHSYATRLINAGIDIIQLQSLLGHSSLATTQNYAKLADTTLARGYHAAMEWVKR